MKYLQKIVDCHVALKVGNWIQAADILIQISSVNNDTLLTDVLSFPQKTALVEFAGYMIVSASLGHMYAPDYALFFFDISTDFKKLYDQESLEEM